MSDLSRILSNSRDFWARYHQQAVFPRADRGKNPHGEKQLTDHKRISPFSPISLQVKETCGYNDLHSAAFAHPTVNLAGPTSSKGEIGEITASDCDPTTIAFPQEPGGSEISPVPVLDPIAFEERAAIIEYDGGFDRLTAEEMARSEISGRCRDGADDQ